MATKGSKTSKDSGKSGDAGNETSGEQAASTKKTTSKKITSKKSSTRKSSTKKTSTKKKSSSRKKPSREKSGKEASAKAATSAEADSSRDDPGPSTGRRSAAETAEAQAEAARRATEKAERARARYRRPRARRTEPLRDWSGWFRPGGDRKGKAGDDSAAEGAGREPREVTGDTVIDRGVDLGYRVVEEHIRQGQRTASKMNDRSYGPQEMGEDLWELGQRMVKDYTDFMALWLDFFTSSASSLGGGGFDLFGGGRRRRQEGRRASTSGGVSGDGGTPVVAVVSAQPAWGEVSLDDGSAASALSASALHAASGDAAPLTDVTFQAAEGAAAPRFVVRVPADQPTGLYDGVVRDADQQLRGTLRVRVEAAAEDRAEDG